MFELRLFTYGFLVPNFYKEVKTKRLLGILLRISLFFIIFTIVLFNVLLGRFKKRFIPEINKVRKELRDFIATLNFSYFEIENGILKIDLLPMPYRYSDEGAVLVIDTETDSARIEQEYSKDRRAVILMLKDKISVKNGSRYDFKTFYYSSFIKESGAGTKGRKISLTKPELMNFLSKDINFFINIISKDREFMSKIRRIVIFFGVLAYIALLFIYVAISTTLAFVTYAFNSKQKFVEIYKFALVGAIFGIYLASLGLFVRVPHISIGFIVPTFVISNYYKSLDAHSKSFSENKESSTP